MREKEPLPYSEPHPSSQDPLQQRTAWAISQLATRRYQASCRRARAEWPDSSSSCSSAPVCAICLEEFSEGQVRQGLRATSMTRLGRAAGLWEAGGGTQAGVGALVASVSRVSCNEAEVGDSTEVWLFSWSSRERQLLFVECVPRARICSGCFRCIISF